MLIAIAAAPERAARIKQALEGLLTCEIDISEETEEFHTVSVNFEELKDITVASAVRAVLAFADEAGLA